ncbi:MAG: phage major capsid protein [Leptospirillia bacterium]
MTIMEIRETRSKVVADMRALTDKAGSEERDLNEGEEREFKGLKGQLARLDGQLERAEVIAEAERSLAADPNQPRRGNDGIFEDACMAFSVTRAIAAMLEPARVDAGREFEISEELAMRSGRKPSGVFVPHEVFLERRAGLTSGSGGNLVPTAHRADLMIDRLRAALRVQGLGATILDGLVGNQDIPRLTGSATGYWTAEHTDTTASDQTYDTVAMAPKTVGGVVEYSRRMILNAVPSVERLVRSDLANVLATSIDKAAIDGDGASNNPTGILNTTGIGDVALGTNGAAPTWASVLSVINEVAIDNALEDSLGFLTNPNAVKKMRGTVKVASTDSEMIMDDPNMLAGYALAQSTQAPSDLTKGTGSSLSALIFGNWADLLIGYWSGVDILVNPYESTVFKKGGVLIHALQDCDITVRHPESFAAIQDMVTT